MKILVLSDSHSSLRFMRECVRITKPDYVVHLGDHYEDGASIAFENPDIPFYQVPGNCDGYLGFRSGPETVRVCTIGGVSMLLTHGHRHGVKNGLERLLRDARDHGVQAVLFGHTHCALCRREADGLWVLNPGASGFGGGSAGIMEIHEKKISACRIIGQTELDQWV